MNAEKREIGSIKSDWPLITVITVAFNEVKVIEKTILSVLCQTYENLEYIIVDGGSTDGTVDVIRRHEDDIDYYVTEKDNGIYYAMNKGIAVSKGEYINFLNAGDAFCTKEVIVQVFEKMRDECEDADIIYGDLKYADGHIFKPLSFDLFWKVMPVAHPTMFVKRGLLEQHKFNVSYKIAADYDFLARCYVEKRKFYYSGVVIAAFLGGGISSSLSARLLFENWWIARKVSNRYSVNRYHIDYIFNFFFPGLRKKIDNVWVFVQLRKLLRFVVSRLFSSGE